MFAFVLADYHIYVVSLAVIPRFHFGAHTVMLPAVGYRQGPNAAVQVGP